MTERSITVVAKNTTITRNYAENNPIWKLETEKQERKALADAQRDIIEDAQERVIQQVVIRG